MVGCSLAFHLARAGARVTVFDKEREVCAGMSARSGALLRMHYTFAPEAELAWKSLRYFANWEEMVGRDAERRGCGFVRTGFTIVVGPPNVEKLRANVAMMRAVGVDTSVVEPAELRRTRARNQRRRRSARRLRAAKRLCRPGRGDALDGGGGRASRRDVQAGSADRLDRRGERPRARRRRRGRHTACGRRCMRGGRSMDGSAC